jgi:hypothetical protein
MLYANLMLRTNPNFHRDRGCSWELFRHTHAHAQRILLASTRIQSLYACDKRRNMCQRGRDIATITPCTCSDLMKRSVKNGKRWNGMIAGNDSSSNSKVLFGLSHLTYLHRNFGIDKARSCLNRGWGEHFGRLRLIGWTRIKGVDRCVWERERVGGGMIGEQTE